MTFLDDSAAQGSGCVKCFGMLGKDFSNGDTINSWWAVSHEV